MQRGSARRALADETGAGSVLCVAIVAVVLLVIALLLSVTNALAVKHQVQTSADAAALAAADVAAGVVSGYPCEVAAAVAEREGVVLGSCQMQGMVAEVTASRVVLGIEVDARSRAGPADGRAPPV
ncbi:Rv3654c family TadE-like protein [Subtercola vilae]|uniref:Rv3654c family TadE-like protein n=1 Tax=Subtercola vilae TaxID=2056433 RepID=UPI001375A143|nr:Rv3654c family TadE-like protein [Subtercola vilae]